MENKQKKIEIDEMQESNVFDLFVNKGVYSYVKDITYDQYLFYLDKKVHKTLD